MVAVVVALAVALAIARARAVAVAPPAVLPRRVEANASKSTQVADLTLEIKILIELCCEPISMDVGIDRVGHESTSTNVLRGKKASSQALRIRMCEIACMNSYHWRLDTTRVVSRVMGEAVTSSGRTSHE